MTIHKSLSAVAKSFRGIGAAMRAEAKLVSTVTAAVALFNLAAPVVLLSIVRRPANLFTFNPWLRRLPEYLISDDQPWSKKLSFLSQMAIGWISADNPIEGVEWGFIIDVPTLARILLTSLVFGAYFALWAYRRRQGESCGVPSTAARRAGVAGAVTSVLGLTTGPCTLAGCGVPVLPIVGLAFTGLSSGTLSLFTTLSRASFAVVLSAMGLAVLWFGWRAGTTPVATLPNSPPSSGLAGKVIDVTPAGERGR